MSTSKPTMAQQHAATNFRMATSLSNWASGLGQWTSAGEEL
jgi:hypothetical protein